VYANRQFYGDENESGSYDQNNNNIDTSATFITESKIEKQYRARFILNSIRKRGLGSP
jgi:hypothetical protein